VRERFRVVTNGTLLSSFFVDDVSFQINGSVTPTPTWTPTTSGPTPTWTPTASGPTPTRTPTPTPTASNGPQPGFWRTSGGGVEFYVTNDRAYVDDFAIYITVTGCGSYKITHLPLEAIAGNAFSFSGAFYASGTFSNQTNCNGSAGLSNFYINGCGYVNGGPWSYSALWWSNELPLLAKRSDANPVEEAPTTHPAYHVERVTP